ncbi:uncharacterized protein BXZ73DRAFT_73392 [Epithele typhae]|uniref:uncharacterized protein n=1 Tax=Epithele typhae TaxID=378194 RepID=UPI00200832F8|nr:uncharacterized protein BXZ73DRAFT_73392 [Epithele typhae]KAH9945209.1 hypothetical protein BXZ73DRAFT_73392 [Epithele typhae]
MTQYVTLSSPILGLGLTLHSNSVEKHFTSSEESFNNLFLDGRSVDSYSSEDNFAISSDFLPSSGEESEISVEDPLPWTTSVFHSQSRETSSSSSSRSPPKIQNSDLEYYSDAENVRESDRPYRIRAVHHSRKHHPAHRPTEAKKRQSSNNIDIFVLSTSTAAATPAPSQPPSSSRPLSSILSPRSRATERWVQMLHSNDELDIVVEEDEEDADANAYEPALQRSTSHVSDTGPNGDRQCSACAHQPIHYLQERLPARVAILPATTEAELEHIRRNFEETGEVPDPETFTRPTFITAHGSVHEIPRSPAPAPALALAPAPAPSCEVESKAEQGNRDVPEGDRPDSRGGYSASGPRLSPETIHLASPNFREQHVALGLGLGPFQFHLDPTLDPFFAGVAVAAAAANAVPPFMNSRRRTDSFESIDLGEAPRRTWVPPTPHLPAWPSVEVFSRRPFRQ